MQFKLENFKPVKSAEIKVNDLTLIFGDNNTGKTYIAYALYGLLSEWDQIVFNINFFTSKQRAELSENYSLSIVKNDLDKDALLKNITNKYVKGMASNIFSSQSKQGDTSVNLLDINFSKNKKIRRQIGKDTWLYSDFDDKNAFMNKHKYKQNNIIDLNKVSAYIAENGSVTECGIDKYGMEVEGMDKAIDDLNTVRDGLEARL